MNQELNNGNIGKIKDWQIRLDDLRFENNKLRDKLAKAISQDVSSTFLEEAESFHQKLMDLDQITALMRHEILNLLSNVDMHRPALIHLQFLQMKTDIERCENEFKYLDEAFKQSPFKNIENRFG